MANRTSVNATMTKMCSDNTDGRSADGSIVAATPMTASRLKIFEPTMLPIASPSSPLMHADEGTASSGRLVPSATSVMTPITTSLTPSRRAISIEPSTSQVGAEQQCAQTKAEHQPEMRHRHLDVFRDLGVVVLLIGSLDADAARGGRARS